MTPPASAASLGYAGLLAARRNTRFARYCEDNTLADALFSQHYIIILNKKHFTRYIYDYVYKLFYKQAIFRYNSYYNSVMDYEYSVIGSVYCNAEALASFSDAPVEYAYEGYKFLLRKFSEQISVSLRGTTDSNSKGESISIQEICKNIPESIITEVCKQLSEKFACTVSMRKGYEVYGNANVFNGGSDYEVIEEKWFTVEFDNGVQKTI